MMDETMTYNIMNAAALKAFLYSDVEALTALLDQGLSPDAKWTNQGTDDALSEHYVDGIWIPALHLALDLSNDECFELLLARGANPYAVNSQGFCLSSGIEPHRIGILSILARFKLDFNLTLQESPRGDTFFTQFMSYAYVQDMALIEQMIQLGADPNATFPWHHAKDEAMTPLCVGLFLDEWEHCERLLDLGADALFPLPNGLSPLSLVHIGATKDDLDRPEPSPALGARLKSILEQSTLNQELPAPQALVRASRL